MLVNVLTLGCKLNQLESESIADSFRQRGFDIFCPDGSEPPPLPVSGSSSGTAGIGQPLVIINTCTVTSKSEQKARRIISKTLRDLPESVVIITGCYAQMEEEALRSVNGFDDPRVFVIPQVEKGRLLELPGFLVSAGFPAKTGSPDAGLLCSAVKTWVSMPAVNTADYDFCYNPGRFTFHSRAFLKIQDGCDNQCAYCRTSLARGKSRSLDPQKTLSALQALEENGYNEAVLTGVNISQYRGGENSGLADLLGLLLSGTQKIRLRLSSIEPEPGTFSDVFLKNVSHPRIRPHFHISLQSGSSSVLQMKRRYTPEQAMEGVRLLRSVKDDPFLGCDIITGFPGSSAADFEKTFDFCAEAGFAGIHAFPFSRRPGTEAWHYTERVTEHEAGLRAARLIKLAKKQRTEYIERWTGRDIEAIVEALPDKTTPYIPLLSENYLKLIIGKNEGSSPKAGGIVRCRIKEKLAKSRYDALAEI